MPHNCTDLYLHYVQLFHNGLVAVLLRSCHVKNAVSFNSVKHAGLEKCHPRTSVFLCNDESQRSINAFDFLYFISYKGKIIIVSDRSLTQVNTTAHNIIHDAIQKYNISVSIHIKSICCIPPVINLYFGWLLYNSVIIPRYNISHFSIETLIND